MQEPLLDIRGLSVEFKVFEGQLKVLNDVHLDVRPGEQAGLVGESGCGKTTTMKAVLRILPCPPGRITSGEVLFHNRNVLKLPARELRRVRGRGISMIFQDPTAALNPVFTIGEQLRAVIKYRGRDGLGAKEVGRRAVSVLKEVRLPDPERILSCYPIQLSGGMRQRVCIAMALATEPELIIADEPTTSLDVTIEDQVLRLLQELVERRDSSVIFITHSLGVVRGIADWVYVMYAGSIVEKATRAELFARPLHPYTSGLMTAVPKLTGQGIAEGIPGRVSDYLNPPPGCRFHVRCPHVMDRCRREKPPFFDTSDAHRVACFLYEEGGDG